jgi:hypothetical protein
MDDEQIESLISHIRVLSDSITPIAAPTTNAYGGHVGCLTESVMGISDGLRDIAEAIRELANAVSNHD